MTSDQIRALAAVAEAGSFTAAARAIGRSQSALSRSVAALEREVGEALLVRSPVAPTAAGRAFLLALPGLLLAFDQAARAAAAYRPDPAAGDQGHACSATLWP